MARATLVKKARKNVPGTDIKAGDSYYWWKFRRGGKHYSKTPPRRSQLTQSAFYGTIFDIEDDIASASPDDGLRDLRDDVASRLRELGEECQSSLDNMPEGLQQGDTGQLLEERVQAMESSAEEFESLEMDDPDESEFDVPERDKDESDEDYDKRKQAAIDEATESYWQEKLDELHGVTIEAP